MAAPPGYSGDSILQQPASPVEMKVFQGGGMIAGGGAAADSLLPQPDAPVEMKVFQGGGPAEYEALKKDSDVWAAFKSTNAYKSENLGDISLTKICHKDTNVSLFILNNLGQLFMYNEGVSTPGSPTTPPNVMLSVPMATSHENETYDTVLKSALEDLKWNFKARESLPADSIFPIFKGKDKRGKLHVAFLWVIDSEIPPEVTASIKLPPFLTNSRHPAKQPDAIGSIVNDNNYAWIDITKVIELMTNYKETKSAKHANFGIVSGKGTELVPWREIIKTVTDRILNIKNKNVDAKPPPGGGKPPAAAAGAGATGAADTDISKLPEETPAPPSVATLTFRGLKLDKLQEEYSPVKDNLLLLHKIAGTPVLETMKLPGKEIPIVQYSVAVDKKISYSPFKINGKSVEDFFMYAEGKLYIDREDLEAVKDGDYIIVPYSTSISKPKVSAASLIPPPITMPATPPEPLTPPAVPAAASRPAAPAGGTGAPAAGSGAPAARTAAPLPPPLRPEEPEVTEDEKVKGVETLIADPDSGYSLLPEAPDVKDSKTRPFEGGVLMPRIVSEEIKDDIKALKFTQDEKKVFKYGAKLYQPTTVDYIKEHPDEFYEFWKTYINNGPLLGVQLMTISDSNKIDRFYRHVLDDYRKRLSKYAWKLLVDYQDPDGTQDWIQQKPDTLPKFFEFKTIDTKKEAGPVAAGAAPEEKIQYKVGQILTFWTDEETTNFNKQHGIVSVNKEGTEFLVYDEKAKDEMKKDGYKKFKEMIAKARAGTIPPGLTTYSYEDLSVKWQAAVSGGSPQFVDEESEAASGASAPPPARGAAAGVKKATAAITGIDEPTPAELDDLKDTDLFLAFQKNNEDEGSLLLHDIYTYITGKKGSVKNTRKNPPDQHSESTDENILGLFNILNEYTHEGVEYPLAVYSFNTAADPDKGETSFLQATETYAKLINKRLGTGPKSFIPLKDVLTFITNWNMDEDTHNTTPLFTKLMEQIINLEFDEKTKPEILEAYKQFVKNLIPPQEKVLELLKQHQFDVEGGIDEAKWAGLIKTSYDKPNGATKALEGLEKYGAPAPAAAKGGGRYSHTRRHRRKPHPVIKLSSSSRFQGRTSRKGRSK